MATATVIVPPTAQAVLSGIFRIEITARKIKAWGYQQDEAPLYCMSRKARDGDITAMPFLELAELVQKQGIRRR